MQSLKIIFMGTDSFSVPFLYYLHQDPFFEIVGVVTKVDKKVGRGGDNQQNIVANHAQKMGLTLYKVKSLLKDPKALSGVTWSDVDFAVVVSFGFIIPERTLNKLPGKFVNVHPSLLPKYRGPSPIQSTLLNGDKITGVSIMVLDKGMDTGPILKQKELVISTRDTTEELTEKLIPLSCNLLKQSLVGYSNGTLKPVPQNSAGLVVCSKVSKTDGYVNLQEKPSQIINKYRAFKVWPGIYTKIEDLESFLGIKTNIKDKDTFIKIKQILIKKHDKFDICKVQLPSKPVIKLVDFINGYKV